MRRFTLLLLGCCLGVLPLRGTEFDAANELYDQGRFAEAKAGYEQLVAAGMWSANLFYNLGNVHHRLGAPGPAILGYERALALEPTHPEARANLNFLRGQTGAVPWPESWVDRLFPGRWTDAFALGASVAGWAAVFLLTHLLLTPRRDRSALWLAGGVATVVAIYGGVAVWHREQSRSLAIVIAQEVDVRPAPAESATAVGVLPAGSEVRILSERGGWIYCALPAQGRGWIPTQALGRVRLNHS